MYDTYIIEGGIGKNAAFTSLIPKLSLKEKIQVITPYIDCFSGNPGVINTYDFSLYGYSHSDVISSSNNIICPEPYKSNFLFGKKHIIESYCDMVGLQYNNDIVPKLYTDHFYDSMIKLLSELKVYGKYMMVQFTGGQPPVNYLENQHYKNVDFLRNYPDYLAQRVINLLKESFPDVTIVDATLPNQPSYNNAIKWNSTYWILFHEALKYAEGFISIDSCLNHFSASTRTPGVVLWGSTKPTQFGYTHNTNMQYFMKPNRWDNRRYNRDDPRNVMLDPEEIVEQYCKIQKNKPNTNNNVDVRCCDYQEKPSLFS